jgi:2-oxoisovalerate ferredoxin oxidoreductase delta subunit
MKFENRKSAQRVIFKSEKDMAPLVASVGSQSFNKTGAWRNIRPVVERENCLQCGICWKFCPEPAIVIEDEFPVIDYDFCKGCGVCAEECPAKCIVMVEEEK